MKGDKRRTAEARRGAEKSKKARRATKATKAFPPLSSAPPSFLRLSISFRSSKFSFSPRPSAVSATSASVVFFKVHRALPGKATLVFAKSRLRNLAKHRKQIVTQAPRHGPYLRSTCACAAAQGHLAKGTLLAIGVAIPFIPLIPVSYCFINRDAGDEGDGPLQVGESCLDLSGLRRAPRQSAKNQKNRGGGNDPPPRRCCGSCYLRRARIDCAEVLA